MLHRKPLAELPVISPEAEPARLFTDAAEAVAEIRRRYDRATRFLRDRFAAVMAGEPPQGRYRAWYPEASVTTGSFAKVDSRLSFGHVTEPGTYATTLTRPDLFKGYLTQQISLLIQNHGMPVRIGDSDTPIPLHFAMEEGAHVEGSIADTLHRPLRDVFDVPNLETTDDHIVNGVARLGPEGARPLAPFTAQRIDYPSPASPTTPRRAPPISRTTSCSRTTSSTWTNLWNSPIGRCSTKAPATRRWSPRATSCAPATR